MNPPNFDDVLTQPRSLRTSPSADARIPDALAEQCALRPRACKNPPPRPSLHHERALSAIHICTGSQLTLNKGAAENPGPWSSALYEFRALGRYTRPLRTALCQHKSGRPRRTIRARRVRIEFEHDGTGRRVGNEGHRAMHRWAESQHHEQGGSRCGPVGSNDAVREHRVKDEHRPRRYKRCGMRHNGLWRCRNIDATAGRCEQGITPLKSRP